MAPRRRFPKTTRALQLCSMAQLAVGAIQCLPIPGFPTGWVPQFCGAICLTAGVSGLVGIAFDWYRALITFTTMSWAMAPYGVIRLCQLVSNDDVNVFYWLEWLTVACVGITAAALSAAMLVLKAWRPVPMVSDTTAPLVEADQQPVLDAPPRRPPGGGNDALGGPGPKRAVWPPPDAPGMAVTGTDVRGAFKVAGAMHTGDASNVSARDVAATARVAAAVWPPPQ